MLGRLVFLNPMLRLLGYQIVERCIGHWYVEQGRLRRVSIPYGWRLARLDDHVPGETALDRLLRR